MKTLSPVPVSLTLLALALAGPLAAAEPGCATGCEHGEDALAGERLAVWDAILHDGKWGERERVGGRFAARRLKPELFMGLRPEVQRRLLERAAAMAGGEALVSLCWAPGTDPAVLEAFHAVAEAGAPDGDGPAEANQLGNRWTNTATNGAAQRNQGDPVTVTWSIVPDGTWIPSGNGEPASASKLRSWLQGLYGGSATGPVDQQPWFALFEEVFGSIGAQSGVHYVHEPADDGANLSSGAWMVSVGELGVRGDIRISGHRIDGNYSTLAYNWFPNDGDMVIDTADNFFNDKVNNSRGLFNVLQHEHGHGLGLEHVCPMSETKLMEPLISPDYRGIRFDDIYSIQRLYGDFLERHGDLWDNDSFANATVLDTGTPLAAAWLSIDDNGDSDYYRLELGAGAQVTARVSPSSEVYLEAAANSNGTCPSGTSFDSSDIHNLSLELIGPDQSTVVASASGNPAGQAEEITLATVPSGGAHYLRVTGGSANALQLYELELEVVQPAVAVELDSQLLTGELFAGANGVPDPGETVRYRVTLRNTGSEAVENVTATLGAAPAMTGFTTSVGFGTLAGGGTAAGDFVFALDGDCGDSIKLDLVLTGDGGFAVTLPISFELGTTTELLNEGFDAVVSLATGWSESSTGEGSGWSTNDGQSSSPPRSVLAANGDGVGQSSLESPALVLGADPGVLSFDHRYETEEDYDGCVLEISIDGAGWQDILSAGGVFSAGGYVDSLSTGFGNPLGGRDAWTGDSGSFVTTSVDMPAAAANSSVRLRWIIGHDSSRGDVGWYVDKVVLRSLGCDPADPVVQLELLDGSASEFVPADTARIRLSSELPPARLFPLALDNTGSAEVGPDVGGLDLLSIPVGATAAEFVITAVADGLAEGAETLNLAPLSGTGAGLITIEDAPYGAWASALAAGSLSDPLQDFDGDGSLNIEEYAFGTDATLAASRPGVALVPVTGGFKLPVPLASLPADVEVRAETSIDLADWTETGVQVLADGFVIPAGDPERFLRLVYELLTVAP